MNPELDEEGNSPPQGEAIDIALANKAIRRSSPGTTMRLRSQIQLEHPEAKGTKGAEEGDDDSSSSDSQPGQDLGKAATGGKQPAKVTTSTTTPGVKTRSKGETGTHTTSSKKETIAVSSPDIEQHVTNLRELLPSWLIEILPPACRHRLPRPILQGDRTVPSPRAGLNADQIPIILRWKTRIDKGDDLTWPTRLAVLSDRVVWQVVTAGLTSRKRNENWPLDFGHNGNILLSRPNRGPAATAMCAGIIRDIAFRDHYSLQGDLGVAAMKSDEQSSSWLLHVGPPASTTIVTETYFDMRGNGSASPLMAPFPGVRAGGTKDKKLKAKPPTSGKVQPFYPGLDAVSSDDDQLLSEAETPRARHRFQGAKVSNQPVARLGDGPFGMSASPYTNQRFGLGMGSSVSPSARTSRMRVVNQPVAKLSGLARDPPHASSPSADHSSEGGRSGRAMGPTRSPSGSQSRFMQLIENKKAERLATPQGTKSATPQGATVSDSALYLKQATVDALAANQASAQILQSKLGCIASSAGELSKLKDIETMQVGLGLLENFAEDAIQALKPVPRNIRKSLEAYLESKGMQWTSIQLNPLTAAAYDKIKLPDEFLHGLEVGDDWEAAIEMEKAKIAGHIKQEAEEVEPMQEVPQRGLEDESKQNKVPRKENIKKRKIAVTQKGGNKQKKTAH